MAKAKNQQRGLRIIAGEWRGRRLRLPANTAARPTPDRVRETLFNWLSSTIDAAHCLDLYAGSGALGLEALSRGAAAVQFVESDPRLAASLEQHLHELGGKGQVARSTAEQFLATNQARFDIVFLDPPFDTALEPILQQLAAALRPGALVYVERDRKQGLPMPTGVHWRKQAHAAAVAFGLAVFD